MLKEHLHHLRLSRVWRDVTKGESTTVGVLDSGVANVRGLREQLVRSLRCDGQPTEPEDYSGHGTRCASLIASFRRGATGVAPKASLVSIRITDAFGIPYESDVATAISMATDEEIDLLSCSFTLEGCGSQLTEAVSGFLARGGVIVAAAGNRREVHNEFPRFCRGVIIVGGVDQRLEPLYNAKQGHYLDVCAPARRLHVVTSAGNISRRFGDTSGATAIVAGVCALALSVAAQYHNKQSVAGALQGLLRSTATDICLEGKDPHTGAGLVNPAALLSAVVKLCI